VEIYVASGEICDFHHGPHGLVRDVLEPLEFQFHLDLRLRRRGQGNERDQVNDKFHRPLE
jgi:hypothetical protein